MIRYIKIVNSGDQLFMSDKINEPSAPVSRPSSVYRPTFKGTRNVSSDTSFHRPATGNTGFKPALGGVEYTNYEDERAAVKLVRASLYKKVKSRYFWACFIPMLSGIIMTLVTIGELVWFFNSISNLSRDGLKNVTESLNHISYGISGLVMIPANMIIAFIMFKITRVASIKDWFPKRTISPMMLIAAVATGFGMSSVVNLFQIILVSFTDNGQSSTFYCLFSYDTELPLAVQIIGCLYITIIGPILEEILYRGLVLNLCSHISRKFAFTISAFLFALMHMNIAQFITTFVLGLIIAHFALKSHSLLPGILLHITFNSTTFIVDMTKYYCKNDSLTGLGFLLFLFSVAGIILFIIYLKRYPLDERTDGMKTNPLFDRDEIHNLQMFRKKELTSSAFFSTGTFWGVIAFYGINLLLAIIMAVGMLDKIRG